MLSTFPRESGEVPVSVSLGFFFFKFGLNGRREPTLYLVRLDEDEYVIDSDGENEERNDLDDDQTQRNAHEGVETDGRRHRNDHHQHSRQPQHDFRVDLRGRREEGQIVND